MSWLWQVVVVIFFFKQKTAYEMRISDWSSDVCSSDLSASPSSSATVPEGTAGRYCFDARRAGRGSHAMTKRFKIGDHVRWNSEAEIGRASCRERVWQYV